MKRGSLGDGCAGAQGEAGRFPESKNKKGRR